MTKAVHHCHCGNHAWAELTRGYITLISPEFAQVVGLWKWKANASGRGWYAARNHTTRINGERRTIVIWLHRTILTLPHGLFVDHINRNTLDNRLENLRAASASANSINRRCRTGTSSKYRGVSRRWGKWRALITINGVRKPLGAFETEIEAALAYDREAKVLHGEFAVLNFKEQKGGA